MNTTPEIKIKKEKGKENYRPMVVVVKILNKIFRNLKREKHIF